MSARGAKVRTFDKKLKEERDYWLEKLAGRIEPANLRPDFERPRTFQAQMARVEIQTPADLQAKLTRLTAKSPMLIYAALLAALKVCLHKYTRKETIIVGSPALLKKGADLPPNALALLDEITGDLSYRNLLENVRGTMAQAYARQNYSYQALIRDLGKTIEADNRCALFDVALMFKGLHGELPQMNNDMNIIFSQSDHGLSGEIEYCDRLFKRESIERFRDHFLNILDRGVSNVDLPIRALEMLADDERRRLLVEWNSTACEFPSEKCIHHMFEAQAERTPDATAAAFEAQVLSYDGLNRRSNQLAHYLREQGVGPEVKVGVLMDRSLEMLVGLLGIIKAGGAFAPLDPGSPQHRLGLILEDAAIPILLTQSRWADSLPEYHGKLLPLDTDADAVDRQSVDNPNTVIDSENLAYVIYTSGSTGRPKGAAVSHRALINFSLAVSRQFACAAGDRVLQFASIGFDVALEDIFPGWSCGAAVIVCDQKRLSTPSELTRLIEQEQITMMELPTAFWQEWTGELHRSGKPAPAGLRLVIVGGEKAAAETLLKWREFNVQLKNAYGITETAVTSTVYTDQAVADQTSLPIGKPIANTQTYALDGEMNPAGIGVAGEIYIGGEGLARSYVGDAALTADRFIPNLFGTRSGARLYRTGDMAMWLPGGDIEFIGRKDNQIKLRGFRIELGEIESALKQYAGIENAVVIVKEDAGPGLDLETDRPGQSVDIKDQTAIIGRLNTLPREVAERLFADVEGLSDDETAAALAMEMQVKSKESRTRIRRFKDFEIALTLNNDHFISPPRESQRNWLVRRALDEFADDLTSIDEASRRMVPGSARSRLTSEWRQSPTHYDESTLTIQGQQVMQDWESPLMRAMAEIVTESHGDILELGFGMGISATYIQEFGVRSYTVVEYNDGVVERFNKWKRQYPGRDIKLIHGRWHEVTDQLGIYDGIFFDTIPSNEEEYMREVIDNVVMAEDIFPIASMRLRKGGIFTWYTNEIDSFSRRHQRLALKYFNSVTLKVVRPLYPPEDCHYWWADSMVAVKAVK